MRFSLRARKVQAIKDTLYISIPIEYVRNVNLNKGDLLQMFCNDDGTLTLRKKDDSLST